MNDRSEAATNALRWAQTAEQLAREEDRALSYAHILKGEAMETPQASRQPVGDEHFRAHGEAFAVGERKDRAIQMAFMWSAVAQVLPVDARPDST